ncbi:YegP family protein [Arthrobacter sp. PsM3]|uniref:YegP family protein n=1 Tax=Arthrobacter sp. PsM3 TaxID=3030531 RepID=UPI00263BCF4F|nr:DUF1508 domain-containing protein [Arthrobacter sp. PsM3]MDN4643204.1 DUF1508 domain-containing protein [Arthrobacter sp. PsM3]
MSTISPVQPSAAKHAHAFQGVPHAPAPAVSGTVQAAEAQRPSAPGKFELVRDDRGAFLIRILDGNGAVLALSRTYPDLAAAVEGVESVRECAATSHISDQTARTPVLP